MGEGNMRMCMLGMLSIITFTNETKKGGETSESN